MEKINIPQLRFQGFEDEWEEKKLESEVEFYSGLTYRPEYVTTNGTFVIRSSNIKNGELVNGDNIYVLEDKVNSQNVKKYDIVVVVRNGSKDLIGKHAQVKKDMPNTVIGAFMTGIRSKENRFINALLDTERFNKAILKNLGSTINQITVSNFKGMDFSFPTLPEQTQIGQLFSALDKLIQLQDDKLGTLKEQKATFLRKMFPAQGQKVPEIRLQGFEEDWEEKKLGEVVIKEIKGRAKAEQIGKTSTYLDAEYLNGGRLMKVNYPEDVQEKDIIILWDGSQAGTVYHGYSGALGSTFKAYKVDCFGKFVFYQLLRNQEFIFQKYRTPNIPHVINTFTKPVVLVSFKILEKPKRTIL